jgi:oligopeptidase A
MEDLLNARHEIAQLVGFNDYTEYSLATKMAKKPDDVLTFLHDLLARSKPIAAAEYNEIKEFALNTDGITDLHAWDIPYYSEKLQESKFHFTQEELRPYFPIDQVLSGLFTLVNRLYGITIREDKNIDVWHPDVRFFSIYDEQQQLRSGFYIDLYARPHKRDGAWMDDCITRRNINGNIQIPIAYLTCNFMPPVAGKPALLTHDEVITLFHEFGHCLHHMMTKVDFASAAGIHGVPWDAVEFPSQFMENFCWEKDVLAQMAKHYDTGDALPDALYQKMLASKHFQTGLQMIRQLEFALFDFRLHRFFDPDKPRQVQAMLDAVRKETMVAVIPEFNRFQHSFSHIFAGGYAAGYYSYKWAEVLSADAYAQFEEQGIFNESVGRAFLHHVLEVGGVPDPMTAFVAFRGREPKIDALLRHSGII